MPKPQNESAKIVEIIVALMRAQNANRVAKALDMHVTTIMSIAAGCARPGTLALAEQRLATEQGMQLLATLRRAKRSRTKAANPAPAATTEGSGPQAA